MEQEKKMQVVLPNGVVLKGVPVNATQEQILAFAEAQKVMSREEMLMYTDEQDLKDVTEFYRKVEQTPSLGNPAADLLVKPLAKFAYAGAKEPRTLARALPDIGSAAGATGAATLAAATGVGTIPALAMLALGSAGGYFAGKELEEEITGVEYEDYDKTTEAALTGAVDLAVGAVPPAARRVVQGAQLLRGRGGATLSTFETEAEREYTQLMAQKLQEKEAGLLTIQAGDPTKIGSLLFDVGRASVSGKREIQAVLEGQSEYLRSSIDTVLNQFGDRVTNQELGEAILSTVEGQKSLSNRAFEGLYENVLGESADVSINVTPFKNQVIGFINASKKNNRFYQEFSESSKKIKEADVTIIDTRRSINRLRTELEYIEDPEIRARIKKAIESNTNTLESARIDKAEAEMNLNDLKSESRDAFEDSALLSKYEDLLRMDDNMTNRELAEKLRAIRSEISEIRVDSPAKVQKPLFGKLVDAQNRLEKILTNSLEGEDLANFKMVDELYKNNAKLLRGEAVTKILGRQESAETIASLFTDANKMSYFDTFNKILRDTPNILRRGGIDETEVKAFIESGEKVRNAVVRKYLELNLSETIKGKASEAVTPQDSFKVISDFLTSLSKRAGSGADKFDQMMSVSSKGAKDVIGIIDDYKFLVKNLPQGDQGRFTLAVVGAQSAGLSQTTDALTGAPAAIAGGDVGFAVKLASGLSKMLAPERIAYFVTNPEEAKKLASISKATRKMIETGRTNTAVLVALGNSYNRMLSTIEEETTAQSALSSYFGEEFSFPKKPKRTDEGEALSTLPQGALFGM